MRRLNNVLYIMTEGSYLHCENDTISVKIEGKNAARIPAHTIESIVCLCNTTVSTPLIGYCGAHGIGMTFHSSNGKFYGRVQGPVNGNVLLRKKQFELIGSEQSIEIVRNILSGKLANSRNFLLKNARDNNNQSAQIIQSAANLISREHGSLMNAKSIDSMRGIEGSAASIYFSVFDEMLKTDDESMAFLKRSRRPPENRVNALLSFVYMLLKNDVQSALESVGFDPAVGYLHAIRPGRPSLALDLMEELRVPLCDRMVISLINLRQLKSDDIVYCNGEYKLSDGAKRLVIDKWQKRKKEEIAHSYLDEKIPIGLIPYCQAMLLSKYLRSDIDAYPAFLWR